MISSILCSFTFGLANAVESETFAAWNLVLQKGVNVNNVNEAKHFSGRPCFLTTYGSAITFN